ncbi:MAG: cell wall metabolism sensor histidine kinase WalK [Clostridiales bacterium]|nr:cell wall metabolism sensor histidine kinase WalK [Clostridiales bacterium]
MITVMCVIGTILINNVNSFYMDEFTTQMDRSFSESGQLMSDLYDALWSDSFAEEQYKILDSYQGVLGIDNYRDFYILDINGKLIKGSSDDSNLKKTANMLAAMSGEPVNKQPLGSEFADYALLLDNGDRSCLIYVKDTMDEMQQFTWRLFSIILQALMFGLIFAVILAFFLSKAITSPIQSLTRGAKLVAAGEFSHEIDVHSHDEIGTLTDTFNYMKTRLKSTIEEVSGEHRKLEMVFTYLRDGVVAFAEDGRVMHINQSLMDLLGDKYDDSFNFNKLLTLFGVDYSLDFNVEYVDRPESSSGDGYSVSDIMFDGKVLDVSFGRLRYTADNVSHNGVLAVIHDETGRYELDKSRREFVANVSHEMRTPLTSIKGACETILSDKNMQQDMQEFFLNMAVDECDRMTRIVSDLLVLSRLDNKRTKWNIQSFDIDKVLNHICEVMKVDAAAHQHSLSYTAANELPFITADKERIEQVLINVISNSIKYTPEGGKIELLAGVYGKNDVNPDGVEIFVKDNGIGIPEEDLPHLFERFYRVEKSRTSETGGTGLGLAIAKEIVDSHGGSIEVESSLGEGTTVIVRLPIETKLKTVE